MPPDRAVVNPVLFLADAAPLDWGLDPARLRCPATIVVPPGASNPLARRTTPLPSELRVLTLLPGDDPASPAGRVRLLARAAQGGADDDLWVWVDAMYAASQLSLEVLYSELFAARIRVDRGEWPLVYGHHGFHVNPVILALTSRELAAVVRAEDRDIEETFDPYPPRPAAEGVMPVDVAHLGNRPSVHFQRLRTQPVVHIIGDSHAYFCFTPRAAIGSRNDIVVRVDDVTAVAVPYAWQFTHHRGPLTMYRIGRDAGELNEASLAEIDVRDGDAIAFVFGEIDVRCHVLRQHEVQGRPVEEIIERLTEAYIARLAGVAARLPRSKVVVVGVIPPFDPPNYGPANPPIAGTLAQRVAAARLLNAALQRRATDAGLAYVDAIDQLAGADGSLPHERSDYFCHLAFEWAHVAAAALYERLRDAPREAPTIVSEDLADLALHHIGRTRLQPRLVVIGAMDGRSFDDFAGYINLYQWSGLFVEPVPEQFRRLRAHYGGLAFAAANRYENSAIAEHDGAVEMLTINHRAVDEGKVPPCFGGMSAIYPPRNGLASNNEAATVAAYGERITVPCVTLRTLFDRHAIDRVDVLQIDAEGWDYRILRQLDFARYRPKLIRCEWINLAAGEQSALHELLAGHGFVVRVSGMNLDAVPVEYWRDVTAARQEQPTAQV